MFVELANRLGMDFEAVFLFILIVGKIIEQLECASKGFYYEHKLIFIR